ncbi:NTF2-like protein [Daldinia sp. FL1419]|nr:NTF2-like protein [Daldinia sp. FL1419]
MAPSGPRKGSAPTGPRNSRGSTTNSGKAASRGGISKRRSNTTGRVDKDGDLDMDAPNAANRNPRKPKRADPNDSTVPPRSTRSTINGSRAPRPNVKTQQIIQRVFNGTGGSLSSRIATGMSGGTKAFKGARPVNAPNTMTLRVEGLKTSKAAGNEGGGLKELLTFLERKAQAVSKTTRNIRIKKSQLNGDFVYITASKEDAEEILKLDGFAFAGTTLAVIEAPGEMPPADQTNMSSTALEVKDALRNVLSLRYDGNAKLLNLSSLGEDAGLTQMGFFSGESKPEKLFRALMAVCDGLFKTAQDKRDAVVSISLAGNSIDDVLQIMSLADTFPDLINLDLSRNSFKDLKGLQKWRHRLRKLETLLLNDNPIEGANPNYAAEVTSWFPRLLNLSGIQVRTPEQVAAMEAAARPTPIPQHGADFRDINGVGEGFIREFISMYDVDRNNLAAKYYDNESTFSIAVTNPPHSQNNQSPGWGAYIKFSRNHNKITHTSTRIQRLFVGTNLIQGAWQQLPPTRHPDLLAEFNKYIIDCHPVHGLPDPTGQSPIGVDGMIITMHGEFEDQEPNTMKTAKRSFSRTFILGPGVPGRNQIRVISDMLSLRAFNPPPGSLGSAPEPTVQPVAQLATQPNPDLQQQMVVELCKQTNMTPEYSKFCLDGANWNFDQALAMFNEKRAQLPADAFVTPLQ